LLDTTDCGDADLLNLGADFAALDTVRQGETDGRIEELTEQWWSIAEQIAASKPLTIEGTRVQLTLLRRIIEDTYLTDDCPADGLVRRLFHNLAVPPPAPPG
jgi:hypothetical protein